MTNSNKTFKDLKDAKEQAKAFHGSKEGHRAEKGGHKNLIREAAEELQEEALPEPEPELEDDLV